MSACRKLNLIIMNSICLTVCYYMSRTSFRVNPHSTVYLNVKELLARSRCLISSLNDSNEIRTHNHLVRPVWLNGRVFFYKLSGCGFESRCCHSICLVVSSLEMQRRLIQTNVHYKFFTLFQKKNDSQTFKSSSFKKPSLQFYLTDKTCFDECFLFHLITESHCFL